MNKLDQAKKFLAMGIAVIPLYHRNKKPDTSITGGQWEQYSVSLPSLCDVQNWLLNDWRNYGVVAGWNNLVVIDFDNIEYFNIWRMWADDIFLSKVIDMTFKVKTSRGIHVYMQTMETVVNDKRISKKGGIDVQAQRKFVVGPKSIHPSGHVYEPIGEMVFSIVDNIESILPLDLFPRVANEIETGIMPVVDITPHHTDYEYDPFAIASNGLDVDLITKVKRAVRIETWFSNVQRSSTNGQWMSCVCPFHNDKRPSAWIDVNRQLFGCEVCRMKPMDVINLYARMHNVSESLAVSQLAREVGVWG